MQSLVSIVFRHEGTFNSGTGKSVPGTETDTGPTPRVRHRHRCPLDTRGQTETTAGTKRRGPADDPNSDLDFNRTNDETSKAQLVRHPTNDVRTPATRTQSGLRHYKDR